MDESNAFSDLIEEGDEIGFRHYTPHRIIRLLRTNEVVVLKSMLCIISLVGILTIASISIHCKENGKGTR